MASYDEVVPPGEAGKLRTSIHTSNLKGPFSKAVTVTHDDPASGPVALTVKANVVGSVLVLPAASVLVPPSGKKPGTPARILIRRDPTEQGEFRFTDLTTSVPWVKVSSRAVTADEAAHDGLPDARSGDVELTMVAEGAPVGVHLQSVTFKTGLAREPLVTVPVRVVTRPPIHLQPSELILNPDPNVPGTASGQVLGSLREDVDAKDLVVSADAPAFKVRLEPPGVRAFRVIVEWSGSAENTPTETTVRFRAGEQSAPLRVRVNLSRMATPPARPPAP